jgi:hypothetical protein
MPEWVEDLLKVSENLSQSKMTIFSGHDSSLGPILSAMEVIPSKFPDFGSNVLLN